MFFIGGMIEIFTSIVPGISGTAIYMLIGMYDNILMLFSNILNSSDKNMFVISDGKIIFTKKQNGVGINENFYSYDNKVINIYDENFNIARELVKKKSMKNILNVYVLQDEIIEVEYLNSSLELKNAFYDKDGEIIKNSYNNKLLKKNRLN